MEKYSQEQRLGKGAQGAVYLVKNKNSNELSVLKKVECNDESEANQAFTEACALQELKHPYICGYKEFFVHWDKMDSAMYFAIVMDYYKKGDLDSILRSHRKEHKAVDEELIKKWLGEIIEVLVFINDRKVIHRDLKPSNIFVKEDEDLALGDFGVATVMGDVRTKARTAVGSMNWMAPEVLDRPYDERSDIWSLGCIVLEMMTCSFMSALEMSKALSIIKNDPEKLEEILEKASDIYDKRLSGEVRHMLRRNYEHRPNAKKMIESPFIAECMAISGSALVDRKRRQEMTTKERPVPVNKGVAGVLKYLEENYVHENCIREGLEWLATELGSEPLNNDGKRIVAKALRQNAVCGQICIAGCNILSNSALAEFEKNHFSTKEDDSLFTEDVFGAIVLAMKSHVASAPIEQAAASLLLACSGHRSGTSGIGQCGGVQALLEAMRMHSANEELMSVCCNALWSLCVDEVNAHIATEEQAMLTICQLMRKHSGCPEVLENAIASLLSLSMEDENIEKAEQLQVIFLLLSDIQKHIGHSKLVKNACMTLASFVEADEECALMSVDCSATCDGKEEVLHGFPILMNAYEVHKDNADVVEAIASVIHEIVAYPDLVEYLLNVSQVREFVTKLRNRFREFENIQRPCDIMLELLKGKRA